MKCPTCPEAPLVMTERQGVEIDCCPVRRGVWLGRGELDKLVERSAAEAPPGRAVAIDERRPESSTRTTAPAGADTTVASNRGWATSSIESADPPPSRKQHAPLSP